MSKTIEISKNISLTWFWGGDKKKRYIQITKKDSGLTEAYGHNCYINVELTLNEMKKLVEIFVREKKEKYPKRNC